MKRLIGIWLTALVLTTALSGAVAPLVYEGQSGPGRGQHIVFLAGDHEYRSEETLPALARILARHHGFKCTVLFTVDPATGEIAPGSSNLPGMEALATADLAVVFLRFQAFPPEQMKHFVAYLERGGPIVGLRTSTHAFKFPDDSPFVKYSTEYQGTDYTLGFGHQVLGQTWIGHYGRNHQQSTRITPIEDKMTHPILRGVRDVWVQAGGYVGKPVSGEILTLAQPLQGMTPSSPADPAKPAMPSEWTRTYRSKSGQEARVFTSLYGASEDLLNEGYRRLLVNGIFWAIGKENAIRPDLNVSLVGPFQPTPFRNGGHRREVQPSELAGWDTPIMPANKPIARPTPVAAKKSPSTKKAAAAQKAQPMAGTAVKKWDEPWTEKKKPESATHAPDAEPPPASIARAQTVAPPAKGERIVFLGNGLAERDVYYSRMEAELHLRFPEHALLVRNMGRPGDTPAFRPHPARVSQWAFPGAEKFRPDLAQHNGKGFFPTPDQWLTHLKADTIVAFFGYNESFDGPSGVANYEAELDAFVRHTLTKAYNGSQAPRLVLVSPIAFENLSANRDLPDGRKENVNLALYTEAMKRVAQTHRLTFIDLFHATRQRYAQGGRPFTINGFAPTEAAYQELGVMLAEGLFGPQPRASRADPAQVHAAVKQKDWFWNNDYNLVNGVHTHGQRYSPYGPQNYPDEVKKTREMMTLRDELIHAVASGKKNDLVVDDSQTHPLPPVPTNFAPSEKNGSQNILTGERAVRSFTVAPGYQVELFASEHEFPDLRNPVQMSFDNKGRLWVAVMPTYPHYRPGDPLPNDKLIILEDTDGDGRADKQTVFADGLHLPIGFEIAPEGVYVSQEPNLCLLVDDDGDDRADRMEYLLHGFDTHDTHHAISAYSADASGAFYLAEGRFLHSQVETPYGPRRMNDGGVWRFDPKSFRLERYSQADYSNPWGISFNRWEQMFISDASPGENWWGLPLSAKMPYGVEIPKVAQFVPKRSRPTSGAEFVSSRHFPDEQQGDFMICNSIGFLGISFGKVRDDGAGFTGDANGDLLSSSDGNFRPVDLEFAPDGSLYFIDWHNLLIGHMQHNARDPNRDHDHGRVYRITYPARPLVTPAKIAGASIPELLENLKLPEYRTRYRTRRELRGRPADQVIPAVKAWAAKLDKADPNYEHHLCEALWATWAQNRPDVDLLRQCLSARQPEARAAAASVLRFAHDKIPESTRLLMQAVQDEHPRVRLEAIVAASWLDNADGARIALEGLKQPLDRWMGPVTDHILKHTLKDDIAALQEAGQLPLEGNPIARDYLSGQFKIAGPAASAEERSYGPTRTLTADQRKIYDLGKQVFHRDAHCATCHQSNGRGLTNVYPPLTDKEWLRDDERLIKLVLKGLWGPIEVNGERFDPSKGVPPMMGFAPLLNDEEMAAVLSYVRQSFGNDGEFVSPEQVKTVRDATKDRVNFYTAEELLQAHPYKTESR